MSKHSIYPSEVSSCIHLDLLRIAALAKIGAAASDTNLNVDLKESGYLQLFETIAEQATALTDRIPD